MATKTGFRDLQRTSLLRDTRISTRLWVLIGVSLVGLVYFAITSGLRVRDQARLVEGGLSIRELANLSQQAASAVSDAKQNNGDSVEKMKAFTQWIAQSPLGARRVQADDRRRSRLRGGERSIEGDAATCSRTRNGDPVGRRRRRSGQRVRRAHPRRFTDPFAGRPRSHAASTPIRPSSTAKAHESAAAVAQDRPERHRRLQRQEPRSELPDARRLRRPHLRRRLLHDPQRHSADHQHHRPA